MKLSDLPRITSRGKKRLGRGYGSKKGGHTSSRGQKGQKSRSSVPIWFEGGQLPQIRRFPFIRGKSRFKSLSPETVIITLDQLNKLPENTTVTPHELVKAGIINEKELETKSLKVLANGTINKALTVTIPVTQSAQEKIQAAGGKVKSGQNT